jgi:hypothetical protein
MHLRLTPSGSTTGSGQISCTIWIWQQTINPLGRGEMRRSDAEKSRGNERINDLLQWGDAVLGAHGGERRTMQRGLRGTAQVGITAQAVSFLPARYRSITQNPASSHRGQIAGGGTTHATVKGAASRGKERSRVCSLLVQVCHDMST